MTDLAIHAEHIGKRYRIMRGPKDKYRTLRDAIAQTVTAPARALRARQPSADELATANGSNVLWALKDVSFDIRRGEVIGIIGHNGAGKSTLLKILTRITEPTRGTIDLWGRVGSLLEVGTGFHKELSGSENIYLNGAILGMSKSEIDKKFDEIVEFAEVQKFIYNPVKYYSSGMTVRLAFAVAAHLEPEILLVDEVLAVGDANFQRKCLAKMEDIGQGGRTVLFVSHQMPHITRLCDRTILLKEGQVLADGPTQDVVGDYLSSALGTASQVRWDNLQTAPGNDVVRLRGLRIKDEGGKSQYTIDITRPVGVEIEFEVIKPGRVLYPYFGLNNDEGIWLFTSIDTSPEWRGKERPVGRYVTTGWIPGNMLAEGTMMISAGLRTEEPFINHVWEKDAVAFQVIDALNRTDTPRVDNARRHHGVMRPYFEWDDEYISVRERIS